MNSITADWRKDLEESRDLSDQEKPHFGFVWTWFETWRLKQSREPCREAAIQFWRDQVKSKVRKEWQLQRWAEAMRWYERWLKFCLEQGHQVCTVRDRMRKAVMTEGQAFCHE